MNKIGTTLKLPRIEEYSSHKSQPSFHPTKDMFPGPLRTMKGQKKSIKSDLAGFIPDSDPTTLGGRRGFSSDKALNYGEPPEDSFFVNSSMKQSWLLKKLEEKRESLQKKPQFLGLRDTLGHQNSAKLTNGKAAYLNQILNSMSPPGQEKEPLYPKKKAHSEEGTISKSVNLGQTTKFGRATRFGQPSVDFTDGKNKPEGEIVENSGPKFNISQERNNRLYPGPISKTPSYLKEKLKFPALGHNDENDPDRGGNVKLELIITIEEKLRGIFENIENKGNILPFIKDYLELVDQEEIVQVEALFYDTRMRRNLKTYIMLERTGVFTLLSQVGDDADSKDSNELHLRNICHYLFSNFLNFIDILIVKLDFLPRYSQSPSLEKLKDIAKEKAKEVDRSFSLEQVNKLLLKVLRTTLKQHLTKKGERYPKSDLLLEKIEFGLMLNYSDELKGIFQDLISKYSINILPKESEPEIPEPLSAKKKPAKPEKTKANSKTGKASILESNPAKEKPEKDYHLPPAIPKPGEEHKPIYSLVLDMDETLIHFEEVAGKGRFFVRPYAEKFLKEMSELYEITIFTAGVKDYADAVLNILDPHGYISHRLYRHHTTIKATLNGIIKDLSKIGRDLSKTIIIDNAPENFRLQQDNGIEIISWYNDPYDTELLDLMPFLKDLVIRQVEDVRKAIKKFKEKKKKRLY